MQYLPTDTVTFLFTDVVGSTVLWEQHPEGMRQAMRQHDGLVEQVVEAHGGQVVRPRGEGDSRFAVFARAGDAVAAAYALQQALYAEPWPLPVPLRVRMALHTGETELRANDYYGSDVNRAARLRALAHPGQTLLSLATVRLASDALPEGASLRDLGQHRLKDLTQPEHIFQLVVPGLPADFPPLQSLGARPHNLPLLPTPLIGRQQELTALVELLEREMVRLVTVTGPGGMGKTRISLQVAAELLDDFPDGVFFVDLAPISDPALVIPTIAHTLHLQESGVEPLTEILKGYLRDKALLLVLDNFEQVVESAPLVAELLAACPTVEVLATSREPLQIRGEQTFPLPPLALPELTHSSPASEERVASLAQVPAVALFVQRAQAVKPSFVLTPDNVDAVAEICRWLDGLPLAIELAAARIKLFAPQALLARFVKAAGGTLHLLTGGARDLPARHQTLRDTIAWSYHLLAPSEQALFRRLGVFVGGATFEAVEAVCNQAGDLEVDALDGLASLLDKSLLQQREQADGEPHFFLLRTIQAYALEQLEASGESQALRQAHAHYYLALSEEAEPHLTGAEQASWLERLELEHDNLRTALRWSEESGDAELGLRLAGALWRFWMTRGYLSEGRAWLERVLSNQPAEQTVTRAKALHGLGTLAIAQSDYEVARAHLEESLMIRRMLGDKYGIAVSLNNLGLVALEQGDPSAARPLYEESLALSHELGDREGVAMTLHNVGVVTYAQGDILGARALYEESLALQRQLGNQYGVANSLNNLGLISWEQGRLAEARVLLEECLTISRALGNKPSMAVTLHILGTIAGDQGDYDRARFLLEESLALRQEMGDKHGLADSLEGFAQLMVATGKPQRGVRLCGAAEIIRETIGAPPQEAERVHHERYVAVARAQLDESTFATLWTEGRAMTLEQAIAYALDGSA
ncbi:MAG: tetratricopeptide repeat protein [Chloroflexota bacterium]|nr:tetratricopeptide repeat protein [Chloroflexota bacterium]